MSKLTDALVDFRKGQAERDKARERAGLPTSGDIARGFLGVVAPGALPPEPPPKGRKPARSEERSTYGVEGQASASPVVWLAALGLGAWALTRKRS